MTFVSASEDAEFMIKFLEDHKFFGSIVHFTTTHVAMLIVTLTVIVLAVCANIAIRRELKRQKAGIYQKPGAFLNVIELAVEFLDNMVVGNMGKHAKTYRNYILSIFVFVILCNISGIFGLRAPTADYGVTLCLGLGTFILIHASGIRKNKLGHFGALFQPIFLLFPINVISEVATPMSLSLRLFGNIMAGTVMMGLWYGLMPIFAKIGIPAFLHMYLDLFSGVIQTYVFCMLSMTFIEDKIHDEE